MYCDEYHCLHITTTCTHQQLSQVAGLLISALFVLKAFQAFGSVIILKVELG